jgi:putative ABC transport system permease protein
MSDVRFAVRLLLRSPVHTITAALALALGIGATVAIFSAVYAVLYRPLPLPAADRLVVPVSINARRGIDRASVPYADYADWRNEREVFESVALYRPVALDLSGDAAPERVNGLQASEDYFAVMAVGPIAGRLFTAADYAANAAPAVVLGDGLWRRRFGADPSIAGKTVRLAGVTMTVAGVVDAGPLWPREIDIWLPLKSTVLPADILNRRDNMIYQSIARLKPGVPIEQGQARLKTIAERVAQENPSSRGDWSSTLLTLRDYIVDPPLRLGLLVLMAGAVFVLLIACVNLANLLLARGTDRAREMALRSALGASRARLVRQLVTESLLLAVIGGGAGVLLAQVLIRGLVLVAPPDFPMIEAIGIDRTVAVIALGLTLLTGLVFGLAPAIAASAFGRASALKDGSRAGTGRTASRMRDLLVIVEMALAVVLLAAAGLLLRSFDRLLRVDTGVRVERVLTGRVALPGARYQQGSARADFYERLVAALESTPGVDAAAASSYVPAGGGGFGLGRVFLRQGQPEPPASVDYPAQWNVITPGFFRARGMRVVRGRAFSDRDRPDTTPVMIINETMARRIFGSADPLGQRLRSWRDENVYREIVGVVSDVRYSGVSDDEHSLVFVPHRQDSWGSLIVVLQTSGEPAALGETLRREVARLDRDLAVARIRPLASLAAASISPQKFGATLLAIFAGAAALLAGIGIYSVMAYAVARRTQELGLRLALGATPGSLVRLVLARASVLTAIGAVTGLVGAVAVGRLMRGLLFGISPNDVATLVAVPMLLAFVALVACTVPARRAANTEPLTALRIE